MKELRLTQGKIALVDDCDFDALNKYRWWAEKRNNSFYARTKINKINVYMHRHIMKAECDRDVDHKDQNPLNNQRSNLRLCSRAQNQLNKPPRGKSKYKGVYFDKRRNKYYAQITIDGKTKSFAYGFTEEDAAKTYDVEAKKLHGEFAHLNFK